MIKSVLNSFPTVVERTAAIARLCTSCPVMRNTARLFETINRSPTWSRNEQANQQWQRKIRANPSMQNRSDIAARCYTLIPKQVLRLWTRYLPRLDTVVYSELLSAWVSILALLRRTNFQDWRPTIILAAGKTYCHSSLVQSAENQPHDQRPI